MTIKRIKVKETAEVDEYYFTGELKQIIEMLQQWMNEGEWEGIEYDHYLHENSGYYLYKFREETDKEYEKRLKQLEKEKADKAKAKELKLEQLKKDLASLSDDELKQLGVK